MKKETHAEYEARQLKEIEQMFAEMSHAELVKMAKNLYEDCGRLRDELDKIQGIIR